MSATPGSASQPQFANDLFADRHTVDQLAGEQIDPGYACAVVTPRQKGKRRSLLIYAISDRAAQRARNVRPELRRPARVRVRVTSKRYRQRTMNRLLSSVNSKRPQSVEATAVALESPLALYRCPRVEITLLPEGQASPEMEDWAKDMRERYGNDRVVTRRAELTRR